MVENLCSEETIIKRSTIIGSASIGSLYDINTETLLPNVITPIETHHNRFVPNARQFLCAAADRFEKLHFLSNLGLDYQLRSSTPGDYSNPYGIHHLLNYEFPHDNQLRYLYFEYISSVQTMNIKHSMFDIATNATHVITKINNGLQMFIVVEVDKSNQQQFDHLIKLICEPLKRIKKLNLTHEQIPILQKCSVKNLFGNLEINTRENTRLKELIDRFLTEISSRKEHPPFSYEMHRIDLVCDPHNINKRQQQNVKLNKLVSAPHFSMSMTTSNELNNHPWTWQTGRRVIRTNDTSPFVVHLLRVIFYRSLDCIRRCFNCVIFFLGWISGCLSRTCGERAQDHESLIPLEKSQDDLSQTDSKTSFSTENEHRDNKIQQERQRHPSDSKLHDQSRSIDDEKKNNVPADTKEMPITPDQLPQKPEPNVNDDINVLLLGESGVGKSTFINALVNYLHFDSLTTAIKSKPLVVLPVSFILAFGHEFEEKTLVFGNQDLNENHRNIGQSVTQHCRSYIFQRQDKRIRIIDTPGMGDTRGIEQDQLNLQSILSYINGLPHLNAICMLFKPDKARLDIVTRLYFDQLINFLGSHINENIAFCFTNTRSTFFRPGNTGPLIRQMINDLPATKKKIPYTKENVFCFDSEALRFLIALQNNIHFSDDQKEEYKLSWTRSVPVANRILNWVSSSPKLEKDRFYSLEHGLFLMECLTRPLLESIRQLQRQLLFIDINKRGNLIEITPQSFVHVKKICCHCNFSSRIIEDFQIPEYSIENSKFEQGECHCDRSRLMTIEYKLEYSLERCNKSKKRISINEDLNELKRILMKWSTFQITLTKQYNRVDSFLCYLKQMINEEKMFVSSSISTSTLLNKKLRDELVHLCNEYEKKMNSNNELSIDVPAIYKLIKESKSMKIVFKQVEALEETYRNMIKSSELNVQY